MLYGIIGGAGSVSIIILLLCFYLYRKRQKNKNVWESAVPIKIKHITESRNHNTTNQTNMTTHQTLQNAKSNENSDDDDDDEKNDVYVTPGNYGMFKYVWLGCVLSVWVLFFVS